MSPKQFLRSLVAGMAFTGLLSGEGKSRSPTSKKGVDRYPNGLNKARENARRVRQGLAKP